MKSKAQHEKVHLITGWLRLINWLGVRKVLARDWESRFPAVIVASVLLTLSVVYIGIRQSHLIFVFGCALIGFLSLSFLIQEP
jgi:hypothetical protein